MLPRAARPAAARKWSTPNSPRSTTKPRAKSCIAVIREPDSEGRPFSLETLDRLAGGDGAAGAVMLDTDYYELLQVERTPDEKTIKSAYRKLAWSATRTAIRAARSPRRSSRRSASL
jgi:hypothetical protein